MFVMMPKYTTMVVDQYADQSLTMPKIRGSKQVIGQISCRTYINFKLLKITKIKN